MYSINLFIGSKLLNFNCSGDFNLRKVLKPSEGSF